MRHGNYVDILAIMQYYKNQNEDELFRILGFKDGYTITPEDVGGFRKNTWKSQIETFVRLSAAIRKTKTMVLAKRHDSHSDRLKKALNDQELIPEFWLTAHVNWLIALFPDSGDPPAPPMRPESVADADLWLNGVRITNIHPVGGGDDFLSFELIALSAEKVRIEVIHEYQWIAAHIY